MNVGVQNWYEWLVLPARLMAPGVRQQPRGFTYYPVASVVKSVPGWAGVPVRLGHNGAPVGEYLSPDYDGAITGNVALHLPTVQAVAPALLDWLREGRPLATSPSFKARIEQRPAGSSRWMAEFTALNYVPQHVAIDDPGSVHAVWPLPDYGIQTSDPTVNLTLNTFLNRAR
jgi:hypothetical protein